MSFWGGVKNAAGSVRKGMTKVSEKVITTTAKVIPKVGRAAGKATAYGVHYSKKAAVGGAKLAVEGYKEYKTNQTRTNKKKRKARKEKDSW